MNPSRASRIKWVNSSLDRYAGFQFSWISWVLDRSAISLWFFRKDIVDLSTVDLSIFLLLVETIALSSFTSRLNWSRLFFSLRFRDFLSEFWQITYNWVQKIYHEIYLFVSSLSSPSSSIAMESLKCDKLSVGILIVLYVLYWIIK